jgi:hypothetical protein
VAASVSRERGGKGGLAAGVGEAGSAGRRHAACTYRTAAFFLFLAEGTRVGREGTCRHVCTCAAAQWAVYVQLSEEMAIARTHAHQNFHDAFNLVTLTQARYEIPARSCLTCRHMDM